MRDVLTRAAPPPDETLRYGAGAEQVASVWRPRGEGGGAGGTVPLGTVVFLHGGFWRAAYDRSHAGPLCAALAEAGFLVCAPEYRRTGGGGGWPMTFDDVAAAVDVLPGQLGGAGVVLAGHSAGGHLALWAAGRHRLPEGSPWRTSGAGPIRGVVALAACSELAACYEQGLGNGAAGALMGGSPRRYPDRYAVADPVQLLPVGVPLRLVHGREDDVVPVGMSRSFAERARGAGDDVEHRELPGADHFDVIDPESAAWDTVRGALAGLAS